MVCAIFSQCYIEQNCSSAAMNTKLVLIEISASKETGGARENKIRQWLAQILLFATR